MAVVIGTDEAGYGPNLGPLLVTATCWQLNREDHQPDADLYALLQETVSPSIRRDEDGEQAKVALADSKNLYKPGQGLACLERGLLAALRCLPDCRQETLSNVSGRHDAGRHDAGGRGFCRAPAAPAADDNQATRTADPLTADPLTADSLTADPLTADPLRSGAAAAVDAPAARWNTLWQQLAPDSAGPLAESPWYRDYDVALPRAASHEHVQRDTLRLAGGLHAADVSLRDIRSRAVFPGEFNTLVEKYVSKGELLSRTTMELVRQLLQNIDPQPVLVQCDKHGGRNRYWPLLQHVFPDELVTIVSESRQESVYRWGPPQRPVEVRFTAKGERFLPAALASMTSKYLRELAMEAFNAFWTARVDNLRPTAGYPADAKRYRSQIQTVQQSLGISDHILSRSR